MGTEIIKCRTCWGYGAYENDDRNIVECKECNGKGIVKPNIQWKQPHQ